MREVEDDAVDRRDRVQDSMGIAFVRNDSVHPVRPDVRAEQLDRRRVHVRRMNEPWPTSFRDEDGERSDAGKRIREYFALEDKIRDPLPLRGQPGAEVRLGEVDPITKAMLHVHGRRPLLSCNHLDRSNSALAFHPAVLHRDPNLRIPPKDRESNLVAIGLQLFGNFQDGDIANHVERARKGSAQRLRYIDDVFVASYGYESLVELPVFRRETDVQTLPCREEQTVAFLDDAEMLLQGAKIHELAPEFFAAFPRHYDTPCPHSSAIPPLAVKGFRIQTSLFAFVASTRPGGSFRRKRE